MKNKNQLVPALLEQVNTAWTFIIVSIALAMILVLAGLRSVKLLKEQPDDGKEPGWH